MVKAFKVIKDRNPEANIKLRIGGKGSQEGYLKELTKELKISDDVTFLGFVDKNNVVKEFQNFDIAVFPSTLDSESFGVAWMGSIPALLSFGVAAVEAEACGTPVVVSDVGGLMESTNPGLTSLVAKKNSVEDLADKIEKLVIDGELRLKMGKEARKFVEDNYSLEDNFNDVNKLYEKIINNI